MMKKTKNKYSKFEPSEGYPSLDPVSQLEKYVYHKLGFYNEYYTFLSKYIFRPWFTVKHGIYNMILWLPTVWKSRDHDYSGIYDFMEMKILRTRNRILKYTNHGNSEDVNKYMTIALNLINLIKEDYYSTEGYEYEHVHYYFKPTEDGLYSTMEKDILNSDLDAYYTKYGASIRMMKRDGFEVDKTSLGMYNQTKAERLLHKIIRTQITKWWS